MQGENAFIKAFPRFGDPAEAERHLRGMLGILGITNLTYLAVDVPRLGAKRDFVVSTYSQAWAEHYFDQNYQYVDPVIELGMKGILPFDWSNLPPKTAEEKLFFGEAREFGVSRQGLSIPIRGVDGEKALFSINSDLSDAEWRAFKREHMGDLTMMAYYYHLAMLQLGTNDVAPKPGLLAPREVEVLKWAAEGKSAWDTAVILGLTANTVNFYLRNAAVKLRAVNKTQAVATAVRYDLLS